MGPAEWLGAASLGVALVALVVAGIAASNQLASLKRPLPSVDLFTLERIAKAAPPGEVFMKDAVAWALIIRVTNRGHEPMLNPRVFDMTPGLVLFERSNRELTMPYEMNRGDTVEMVTTYSLANDYDRIIAIVWEEAALFRRAPRTMGIRFHVPAKKDLAFDVTPTEQWKRIGPFGKMGWKRPGRPGSHWRPVRGTSPDPEHGNVWSNTHDYEDIDLYKRERILVMNFTGDDMVGGEVVSPEALAQLRARGELLPKEKPQRKD